MSAISQMGRAMALSGWMGCDNEGAGQVLAMECLALRITPLSLKKRYHITKFGLMDQAACVLGDFLKAGGKLKQVSRTPELASAVLTFEGQSLEVSLSWEDAQKEPFPYEGKEKDVVAILAKKGRPILKAKYATPKSREQMLWWRLIKDTINAHWPHLVNGVPSVEDLGETVDDELENDPSVIEGEFEVASQPATEPKSEAKPESSTVASKQEPPFDTNEVKQSQPANDTQEAEPEYCTGAQSSEINSLFSDLRVTPDQMEIILGKRGVKNVRSLTVVQADELLAGLREKLAKRMASAQEHPKATPKTQCTPEQAEQAKKLLQEMEQMKPGTSAQIRARMSATGKVRKISDLSNEDCEALIAAAKARNIDLFLTRNIEEFWGRSIEDHPAEQLEGTTSPKK